MFRHKDSIRLTSIDAVLFARVTGAGLAPPKTVSDYNRRLADAAHAWSAGRSAGERLLASMAREMMLDPLDQTDVLNNGQLRRQAFA